MAHPKKLKLYGFNNLTKSLSFNIYDICYAQNAGQRDQYIEYIDEAYNADRLTAILTEVTDIIDANILNVARQDYQPQGASVTMLIAEETGHPATIPPETVVAHLDKSHLAVHTYPEVHPTSESISTFRADIDVSTCGVISPLKALNHLIKSFDSDIVTIDYRVRGFTRDVNGIKHYIDHDIRSIQDSIAEDIQDKYQMVDVNVYQHNLFHTRMMLTDFNLDSYLFGVDAGDLDSEVRAVIEQEIYQEMEEIFYGKNFYSD
ncbi:MAG: adenosylmethionine decarboxylase [Pseudomonadota bacterium]